jgi:hypothetical protein
LKCLRNVGVARKSSGKGNAGASAYRASWARQIPAQ